MIKITTVLSFAASLFTFLVGGFFTLKFKAFYIRHPLLFFRSMPIENGVRQMLLSLGGTVGVGNIVGVAVALSIGGSGAVFWMWVGAFFAMALKYAEITLGMLKRRKENGIFKGGAPYYIKEKLGSLAAFVFATLLLCNAVFMGGMIQSSAISEGWQTAFNISPFVVGVILSVFSALIFFLKVNLFSISAYVVPLMSIGYIIACLVIIFANLQILPDVVNDIFQNAFAAKSASGGSLGIMFSPALREGILKGLFSNEAGCGTAPSAHVSSKEKEPCRQGLFGIFEVFADTLVMCTLTAFVILISTEDGGFQKSAAQICAHTFENFFGTLAPPILATFITLFAFCTIIAFGHYALEVLDFFCAGKTFKEAFVCVYCISLFLGAIATPYILWEICDVIVCLMLIINTSAVALSQKEIMVAHNRFYVHIGKYASSASRMRVRSSFKTKNEMPISDRER